MQKKIEFKEGNFIIGYCDNLRAISVYVSEQFTEPSKISFVPKIEMVSGNIGSASLKRLDYTVIGDAVNIAQRLQTIAKAGQIIITEEVYLKTKESFKCVQNGEFILKNKAKPFNTYEVME